MSEDALSRLYGRRPEMREADRKLVRQAINLAEMIARGAVEPKPADVTTFVEARAAFARLTIEEG